MRSTKLNGKGFNIAERRQTREGKVRRLQANPMVASVFSQCRRTSVQRGPSNHYGDVPEPTLQECGVERVDLSRGADASAITVTSMARHRASCCNADPFGVV